MKKTVTKNKKSIKFNNIKYIYYTYSSTEYDRNSIEIDMDDIVEFNDNFDNLNENNILNNKMNDLEYATELLVNLKNSI